MPPLGMTMPRVSLPCCSLRRRMHGMRIQRPVVSFFLQSTANIQVNRACGPLAGLCLIGCKFASDCVMRCSASHEDMQRRALRHATAVPVPPTKPNMHTGPSWARRECVAGAPGLTSRHACMLAGGGLWQAHGGQGLIAYAPLHLGAVGGLPGGRHHEVHVGAKVGDEQLAPEVLVVHHLLLLPHLVPVLLLVCGRPASGGTGVSRACPQARSPSLLQAVGLLVACVRQSLRPGSA